MRLRKPTAKDVLAVGLYLLPSIVVLTIAVTFSWATMNGYWPRNAEWPPCTGTPTGHAPCVMEDGALMANFNGRIVIYPREGE